MSGRFQERNLVALFRDEMERLPVPDGMDRWRQAESPPVSPRRRWSAALAAAGGIAAITVTVGLVTVTSGGPGPLPPSPTESPAASATHQPSAPPSTDNARPTTSGNPTRSAITPQLWPGPDNTGVPKGVTLTTHAGDLIVTTTGATVQDLLVTGAVVVQAPDVTIRRVRIVPAGAVQWAIRQTAEATNLTLQDVEVDGRAGVDQAIRQEARGLKASRCRLHRVNRGVFLGNDVVVEDSYLHDFAEIGLIATGGAERLTVRHNTIQRSGQSGSAIALYADNGPYNGVTIERNLLGGGAYTLHGGIATGSRNLKVVDNRFIGNVRFGPVDGWRSEAGILDWRGNVWHDSGAPVNP